MVSPWPAANTTDQRVVTNTGCGRCDDDLPVEDAAMHPDIKEIYGSVTNKCRKGDFLRASRLTTAIALHTGSLN